MSFERFIAWKHLTRRRKTGFISLISLISVMGVGLGVMALIVVLAVMSGFDRELKSKIVNVQPHLRIERMGGVEDPQQVMTQIQALNIPKLKNIAPFVEGQAILRSNENAIGVFVKGVDIAKDDIGIFEQRLVYGNFDLKDSVTVKTRRHFLFFKKTTRTNMGTVLIGEELALALGVEVGDTVNLISPFQDPKKVFSLSRAESRPFRVAGIFRVGMNDFDSSLALVNLPQAQAMYHLGGRVTGLSLRFQNVDDAQKWKMVLAGSFPADYIFRSWYDMNHNFFQALKVEKSVMTILLGLITLVATFNIVSTLIMVVMEKTKDIGILRALGATRASIRKIFVMEGASIGALGVVAGTVMGLIVAFNLNPISEFLKQTTGLEVFPSDVYYFDRIPAEVHLGDVIWIVIFAFIASVLAGLYPAQRAAKLNPVEALRYE